MPDELHDRWHRAVCKELEERVENRDFWVWVRVEDDPEPAGDPDAVDAATWASAANEVDEWLAGLDPDGVGEDDPPTRVVRPGDTQVELSATPKKRNRRGTDPLIANLYPGLVYPRGPYTAGPAADAEGPGMGLGDG